VLFLIIIYLIASQIQVFHVSSLPDEQRTELKKRSKTRSRLLKNHISVDSKEEFKMLPTKNNPFSNLPYPLDLINLIQEEYGNDQYKFNNVNLPVSFKYNSDDPTYIRHILRDIQSWNRLFPKYYDTEKKLLTVNVVHLTSVQETEAEFVINATASLTYLSRTMHVKLLYYGEIIRTDNILSKDTNTYILQLISIKPIRKDDFNKKVNESDPFLTMQDQMSYVERINYMHKNENNI